MLDWLEVHELHEVVAGELPGRQSPDDIVLFKSNGIAAWDVAIAAAAVERARERGAGAVWALPTLLRRVGSSGAKRGELSPCALDRVVAEGLDDLRPVEQAQPLLRA